VGKIAIRSVLVGGLVDVFVSSLLGAVSVVFVLLLLSIAHVPSERDAEIVPHIVHGNPLFIAAQILIGAGCSLLGGYLAARLARHDGRLNGTLSSFLSVGSGLVSIATGHDSEPLAFQVLLLLLKPAFGFAGGNLRERQVRSKIVAST